MELTHIPNRSKSIINIPFPLGIGLILGDVLAFILANRLSIFAESYFLDALAFAHVHSPLFIVLGIISTVIFFHKGLYTDRTPWWSQVRYIARVFLFLMTTNIALSLSLRLGEGVVFIVLSWVAALAFIIAFKVLVYKLAPLHKGWRIPSVIISDETTCEDLLYAFHSDISTGYLVHTIFIKSPEDDSSFDLSNLPADQRKIRVCFGQDDHYDFINNNPDNFYIISLDVFRDSSKERMVKSLNDLDIPYAVVPTLSRANLYQMQPKYFFGHDVVMLYVQTSAPTILGRSVSKAVKRLMDIGVSSVGLIVIAPIIVTLAISLKLEGQSGSLFYGGRRIGRGGKFFNCWKLRSMEPDSQHLLEKYLEDNPDLKNDWEKYRKLPNDPRVTTKTAKLIRKASLDELPQIWNIFVGDMSLVGPRPILEDEVGYFDEDSLKEYLSVRPGLTGLWQVSGRNQTSFKRRVYWDSWYVRNWSLWGDLVILVKTPIVLLTRKGAS